MKSLEYSNCWYVKIDLHARSRGFYFVGQVVLDIFVLQVIDSIMALFRVDFSGRGELADRQQKLAQMLSRLQKISEGTKLAIYMQFGGFVILSKYLTKTVV